MLKTSSFNLNDLRNEKISIYVVMPGTEYFSSNAAFLRSFLDMAFLTIPNSGDGGKNYTHNDRILFLLDEFTQLGRLDCVDDGMQTARQKGIVLHSLFQDIGRERRSIRATYLRLLLRRLRVCPDI